MELQNCLAKGKEIIINLSQILTNQAEFMLFLNAIEIYNNNNKIENKIKIQILYNQNETESMNKIFVVNNYQLFLTPEALANCNFVVRNDYQSFQNQSNIALDLNNLISQLYLTSNGETTQTTFDFYLACPQPDRTRRIIQDYEIALKTLNIAA